MKKSTMTATKLRLILTTTLFLIALSAAVIFYFANNFLSRVATEVGRTVADANASRNNLQTLQQIEKELENKQEIVQRASQVTADSQNYQYQNQIINDINHYADRAGITVTNISFSTAASSSAPSSTTGVAAPTVLPGGIKTASIAVTIENPVDYVKLLKFMRAIEQNLTRMQLSTVSLSQSDGGVSSDMLNITMYVR